MLTNDAAEIGQGPPKDLGVKASAEEVIVAKRKAQRMYWRRENDKKGEEWIIVLRCG